MAEFIPPATRFAPLPDGFPMCGGSTLTGARVGYETLGVLDARRSNAVLVLTGLSPSAHIASHHLDPSPGWWEAMVGAGRPIDTRRWFVVCVNSLGSCQGSTGPASVDPASGAVYGPDFPDLSIEDVADAAAEVVARLGIERLACVVGPSMGAMSGLALLWRHPALATGHISISGGPWSSPFATAIRSLQREAVQTDPDWAGGRYDDDRYPTRGMLLARKLGLTTYRSPEEWRIRFGRSRSVDTGDGDGDERRFPRESEVESYLERHARRFVRRFDPNCYLYLSQAIDRFDAGTAPLPPSAALEKALVLGVGTDLLFPIHQQREVADLLGAGGTDVQFLALESVQGHDSFLVDAERFGPPVEKFLLEL